MAQIRCPKCQHLNPEGSQSCERCHTALPKVEIQVQSPAPEMERQQHASFRKGQVVAGRYTVQGIIGRGGMGCIYKVHDNTLDEEVALKTLLPQFARDKVVVERFFNEARIARQLSHQNIVRVHDIGTTDGVIYISMEYLRGKSLRAYMENLMPGQRLPLKSVLKVFDELCGALEYAHQYTIHRDIKPENVMITKEGRVKLMDFGISKLMANTQLTQASMVMGTPFYMSPEQLRNSSRVDARADIYSLGIMLYEILTGSLPVGMAKPITEVRPDLPPALDPVVRTCMEAEPEGRYQSAAELREAIREVRAIVDPDFDPAMPSKLSRYTTATAAKSRLTGWALIGAIALLMALGLWQAESRRQSLVADARESGVAAGSGAAPRTASGAFAAYAAVMDDLAARAKETASTDSDLERWVEEGDALWGRAQDSDDAALAREAAQYYLAPIMAPQGMVFVPPGEVVLDDGEPVYVDGFFMDATEVTAGAYATFCVEESWPAPGRNNPYSSAYSAPGLSEFPVIWVTYYDALAFAAAQDKDLPTEAQWARAAYGGRESSTLYPWGDDSEPDTEDGEEPANVASQRLVDVETFGATDRSAFGCYDMVGNVAEWTRTPYTPPEANPQLEPEPGFGVPMVVRGGDYSRALLPLTTRHPLPFEASNDSTGFRCVRPIPADPESIRAILD